MVKIKNRLYRCCSNCAPWKLIVDNGLEDLWRRENPDLPGFTCYDRSFAKDPRCTGSILISILIQKLLATPRLITMVSFTDHYNAISIDRLPLKTKIGNDSWYFNNSFSCKSEVSSATKTFFKKKKKHKKIFMTPCYGWDSTTSRLQPLRGGSLLFTIQFPEIPGAYLIDLRRMKGWVDLGATKYSCSGPPAFKSWSYRLWSS